MTYPTRFFDLNLVFNNVSAQKSSVKTSLKDLLINAFEVGNLIDDAIDAEKDANEIKNRFKDQGKYSQWIQKNHTNVESFLKKRESIIQHLQENKNLFSDLFFLVALLENDFDGNQKTFENRNQNKLCRLTSSNVAIGNFALNKNYFVKKNNIRLLELLQQYLIYLALSEFKNFNHHDYSYSEIHTIKDKLFSFKKYNDPKSIYGQLGEKIDAAVTEKAKFMAFQNFMEQHFKERKLDLDSFSQGIYHSSFRPMIQSLSDYEDLQRHRKKQNDTKLVATNVTQAGLESASNNHTLLRSRL